MDGLLTPKEVAARLRVTDDTVRNWITRGELRATRAGKQYRITEEDLRAFLTRSTEEDGAKKASALAA